MKNRVFSLLFFLCVSISTLSCKTEEKSVRGFFTSNQIGYSVDYGIEKDGYLVAVVHGMNTDGSVCRELAACLNKTEPSPVFYCVRLN